MQCKQCGSEVTVDMAFCGECGYPVEAVVSMQCPQCGATVTADDMFCGECGCKLEMEKKEKSEFVFLDKEITEVETNTALGKKYIETTKSVGIKSTLPSRKENVNDTTVYNEGKKFLKIADDFD